MCTFPNCLCHKRFRGRGPCTSCRAWTSRKCTFFPTPGASPPGTPNWPKLAGKVPAQRHQSPGTSSIGTNVHFPQVLARQAFQESYPPDPAWHKDFTKVHIFANPRGNSLPRIPTDQTVTLLAGIQPAQYHHLLGSSVGTNVHFPQALVPQAFPGTRPLQPLQRLPFTEVHIFAIAGAPLRHSARPADQVTLLLAVVPVRPGAPVRLPRERMFTFRERLFHQRYPGRDPCSPCGAWTSGKCTCLPASTSHSGTTPTSVPALRHPRRRVSASATQVKATHRKPSCRHTNRRLMLPLCGHTRRLCAQTAS